MNVKKLKQLEKEFFYVYPKGFETETLEEVKKKHKLDKTSFFFKQVCSKESLESGVDAIEDIVRAVTRSSMVSVFEKVKFKDMIKGVSNDELFTLLDAINENVYGNEEEGFSSLVSFLAKYKMAKWPLITVFRAYIYPEYDVLMKPTTVKKIVNYLELDLVYDSKPSYRFYSNYRSYILDMKTHVDSRIATSNAAFSGFLMMTIN